MEYIARCMDQFADAMLTAEQKLQQVQADVNDCKKQIQQAVTELKNTTEELLLQKSKSSSEIDEVFRNTAEYLACCIEGSAEKIEEASKGMKFIHDFEKTFIVSVFGKVKAGKSYLGNFIMGRPNPQSPIPNPQFLLFEKLIQLK